MTRWFRWYEGTTEDGKFRVTARNAGVTVRDVIALWAFMLEDASKDEHRGICARNEEFMAAILDFEDGIVERILEAMEDVEMISVGHGNITICHWGERQFETDKTDGTNAERQKRFRERGKKRESNGTVTATKQPETDNRIQITDTSSLRSDVVRESDAVVAEFKTSFWPAYPHKVAKPAALRAFRGARKRASLEEILAGLQRYIAAKPPDRSWLNPASFLNNDRHEDEPAPETHNAPRTDRRSRPHDTFVAGATAYLRDLDRGGETGVAEGADGNGEIMGGSGDTLGSSGPETGRRKPDFDVCDQADPELSHAGFERSNGEVSLGRLRDGTARISGMGGSEGLRVMAATALPRGERELRLCAEPAATSAALPDRSQRSASPRTGIAEHPESSPGSDRGGHASRSIATR